MPTKTTNFDQIRQILESPDFSDCKNIILMDGDKTLCPEDTTRILFEKAGWDFEDLKKIYNKHHYTFEGFYAAARFYSRTERKEYERLCTQVAKSIEIYPDFLKFMSNKLSNGKIILISSGIRLIWTKIMEKYGLKDITVIAGSYLLDDNYVVTQENKGQVVSYFKEENKNVIAVGDSLVDYKMLSKANHAVLVVNNRNNMDVLEKIQSKTDLKQISFKNFTHPGIPIIGVEDISGLLV